MVEGADYVQPRFRSIEYFGLRLPKNSSYVSLAEEFVSPSTNEMSKGGQKLSDNVADLRAREEREPIARFLKMRLTELTPGYAKVMMKLVPEYQNFNGLIFGGTIMAIADQAFAYASNSLVHPSIASQFNIHFVAGANDGDELTAECWVVRSGRRVGISEMKVTNQEGKIIAKATGTTIPVAEFNH